VGQQGITGLGAGTSISEAEDTECVRPLLIHPFGVLLYLMENKWKMKGSKEYTIMKN
jgi:hypothetical protein